MPKTPPSRNRVGQKPNNLFLQSYLKSMFQECLHLGFSFPQFKENKRLKASSPKQRALCVPPSGACFRTRLLYFLAGSVPKALESTGQAGPATQVPEEGELEGQSEWTWAELEALHRQTLQGTLTWVLGVYRQGFQPEAEGAPSLPPTPVWPATSSRNRHLAESRDAEVTPRRCLPGI